MLLIFYLIALYINRYSHGMFGLQFPAITQFTVPYST